MHGTSGYETVFPHEVVHSSVFLTCFVIVCLVCGRADLGSLREKGSVTLRHCHPGMHTCIPDIRPYAGRRTSSDGPSAFGSVGRLDAQLIK